ncbi:MAG: AAA family ATPase [Parabacteroides sp.]|nr:AAA family ATPase [Parabacteroides sp.]
MYGGCFDPVHLGHVDCILQAASRCEQLYVVLSYSRNRDFVPMEYRYRWLLSLTKHIGNVKIILLEDDAINKDLYDEGDYWQSGADEVKRQIGQKIDVVFCGSDYQCDNPFERCYPESEIIYFPRQEDAISSTMIREDVFKYWDRLPRIAQGYFVKKVLLVGGESTGKSVLTQNLALYYNTNFVKETGRDICDEAGGENTMVSEDLHKCLIYQKIEEYEAAKGANRLLFVDTDALITKFYIQFLLRDDETKKKSEALADAISAINRFDLVLFLEPTVSFVQDGTRNEEIAGDREKYSNQIKELLDAAGIKYHCLAGDYHERYMKAKELIAEKFGM